MTKKGKKRWNRLAGMRLPNTDTIGKTGQGLHGKRKEIKGAKSGVQFNSQKALGMSQRTSLTTAEISALKKGLE